MNKLTRSTRRMRPQTASQWSKMTTSLVMTLIALFWLVRPALAHEAPEGSEWVMADWMFLSFILFAGAALVLFLLALKAGLLSNLEDAKYYILDIEEEDYYTPEWAETGGDA